ncbi:MAG: alanine racemase [Caenibius sp.]
MKPLGPIPAGFAAINGELAIGGKVASALVAEAGATPLFVYSRDLIRQRVARLRAALPERVAIHYAVKANPYAPVLKEMATLVDGFDIASGGELAILREAGIDPALVSFAGPGKRDEELRAAIAAGVTLNLESEAEAERALRIAGKLALSPRLAIRVNPDFELRGSGMKMGGGAKPFGIDADRVPALARRIIAAGAQWRGFHIFAGSQALSADALIEAQAQHAGAGGPAGRGKRGGAPAPQHGWGFGIPILRGMSHWISKRVGQALAKALEDCRRRFRKKHRCVELGRYLVGEAGYIHPHNRPQAEPWRGFPRH